MATKTGTREIGVDGWPLGEDEKAGAQSRERQFREDMARCKAEWDAGDRTAAARAVRELVVRCAPDLGVDVFWLVDAVPNLIFSPMSEKEKRQRREWDIHRTRHEALKELRERRHELSDDRGMSWEKARAALSEALKGTEAEGSDGAIKRSYELVEEAGDAAFESYKAVLRKRGEKSDD